MNRVRRFGAWHTDQEVVWLDIPVDEGFFMDRLHTSDLRHNINQQLSLADGSQPKQKVNWVVNGYCAARAV